MILYTADLHLGHANIIRLDHRPFSDVEEMDEYLITRWNDRVRPDDDVYIVGDVCFKSARAPQEYLRRMRGRKHLIVGNHDKHLIKHPAVTRYFETIDMLLCIKDGPEQIVLCHYPLAEWDGFFRNFYHIYGHIHNNDNQANKYMRSLPRALNAGCMLNGYAPCSLRELIANREALENGGKNNVKL